MAQDPSAATNSSAADSTKEAAPSDDPKVEQKEAPSTLDAIKGKLSAFGAKASEVAQDLGLIVTVITVYSPYILSP